MQRINSITLAPAAAAANNISLSQTPGGAGNLTITGALAAGGVATMDMARRVGIHGAGADSGRTFTITGTDRYGRALVEALAGPGTGLTVNTKNDFLTVSKVAVDAGTAGAITVGTVNVDDAGLNGVVSSQWIPVDRLDTLGTGISVVVTGTANYTVEHTREDPFTPGVGVQPPGGVPSFALQAFPNPTLAAQTASKDADYITGITAVRLTLHSYTATASVKMTVTPGSLAR